MISNRSVPSATVIPELAYADGGGDVWTFSESIADIDPASWGGTLRRPRAMIPSSRGKMTPMKQVIGRRVFEADVG